LSIIRSKKVHGFDCLSEPISLIGRLPHAQLARELDAHDVLVLPSRVDSFGMVVAESMACGLPVIVTENVGAKELVSVGENGLIVPVGDSDALADAMEWFIRNRSRVPEMSIAARKTAELYDWSYYYKRAVEFFEGMYSSR
jgi:glycosyltransferase involved in cell wall biosynthesis